MAAPSARPDLRAAAGRFLLRGRWAGGAPHGSGHIHDTFKVVCDDGGHPVRYALQRLNETVFPDLDSVTHNLDRCRTQFRLVREMERAETAMRAAAEAAR